MAQNRETINQKILFETNAEQASKQVNTLNTSMTNLDASFEQVYGDLQPLSTRLGEMEDRMYELALAGKQNTKEFQELQTAASGYRRTIIEVDRAVDASATTISQKLGGALTGAVSGFSAVQGAMGLMGGQSQVVEEALLKVNSAMALAQGVQGIQESVSSFRALGAVVQKFTIVQKAITAGQWLWNAAMSANPIGAIVAAVAALIAAGVALTKYFMSNAAAVKANTAAVEKNRLALEAQTKTLERNSAAFEKKLSQELAMAKASGASAEAIRKLELKLADEKVAYEKSQRAIAENTYQKNLNYLATLKSSSADSELIKKQVEIADESIKQYNKQNQDVQKAFDERRDIQNRHLVEIRGAETESNKAAAEKRKQANEEQKADLKAQKEALKAIEDKFLRDIEDLNVKSEVEKINLDKERDLGELDRIKLSEEEKAKAKAAIIEKYRILLFQKEQEDLKAFNAILSQANSEDFARREEEAASQAQRFIDISDFSTQQAIENNNEQIASAQAVSDHKKAMEEAAYSIAGGAVGLLKEFAGKNQGLQKAAIIAESAIGIAKIITSTQAANAAVTAKYALVPGGPVLAATEIAANKVSAGIGIATSLAATSKALQAVGGGGSAGGGGSVGGASGASAQPNVSFVSSNENQLANTINRNRGNEQPIKAYVVSGDVTTSQSLERNAVNKSSI